ncbi:CDP-alcohol phosphatidyltransferase family protein [Pleionea sp. CnH1-48]|uniref:CDP-alcohol phosphatidyltransferase family protein n=1 Tax=Pleionea sp. CnH1-48 TaxID=2954494 RepID=UPI0020982607|nr:CDP-alcohol phosphatidyltransferase family protein [Pleionea sp. CnH1-48]MCO7222902.1 CDP-alcohol phosphatidyltransferase family protein [Pleionea sp. CnH1-48]
MIQQLPNLITILRVILVIPLVWLLHQERYYEAIWIFFIAGISDGIDGFLAKTFKWESRFGAILDPLADKALLVFTMLMLCLNQKLSWWLFALVTARDVMIITGAYLYHRALGPYRMSPSRLSKANTFLQILLVVSILVSLGLYALPEWLLMIITALVYLSTILSGIYYVIVWGGRYRRHKRLQAKGDE